MSSVIKKIWHIIIRIIEVFLAFIFVMGSIVLYQLHQKPMDATLLLQQIEPHILPKDSAYHLRTKSTIISSNWQDEGLIQINISDLKLLRPDNTVAFSVPKAQFAYDLWHIITLNPVPSTIIVHQPHLDFALSEDGKVTLSTPEPGQEDTNQIQHLRQAIRQLLSFKHIEVIGASMMLQDARLKQKYSFQDMNLSLRRHFRWFTNIHADGVLEYENQKIRLLSELELNRLQKTMKVKLGIPSMELNVLGRVIPELKDMNIPVQLSISGRLRLPKKIQFANTLIQKLNFNIQSLKAGNLPLPAPINQSYDVKSFNINGVVSSDMKKITVGYSDIILKNGTTATINMDMNGVDSWFETGNVNQIQTNFKSVVTNLETNQLPKVWPSTIGPSAHKWVKNHLSNGMIPRATFDLKFQGDALSDLYGVVLAHNIRVDYLPPMPALNNVNAQIHLYPDRVKIMADAGTIDDLKLNQATVLLTDVDIDPSWADVELDVSGPVDQAIKLIASKPLEFAQDYYLTPKGSQGEVNLKGKLHFLLDTDISAKDVQADILADFVDTKLHITKPNLYIDNVNATLRVNNQQLSVTGNGRAFHIPFQIEWLENIQATSGIVSDFKIFSNIQTPHLSTVYPGITDFANGNVKVNANIQEYYPGDLYNVHVDVDATNAGIRIHPFSIRKKTGLPFHLLLDLNQANVHQGHADFKISGQINRQDKDLIFNGSMDWGNELRIDVPRVLMGKNDFAFSLFQNNQDFNLSIRGKSWCLDDVDEIPDLNPDDEVHSTDINQSLLDKSSNHIFRNLNLDIQLDQLVLNVQKPIKNVFIQGKREHKKWKSFHAQADFAEPFILIYDDARQEFQGSYPNLGDLLNYLGVTDRLSHGKTVLQAEVSSSGNIEGQVIVKDVQIREPGFLIQALTILGVVNGLLGNDLSVDQITIPFTLSPQKLNITDALMTSTSVGVSLTGVIKMMEMYLTGTVIPAYAINSLPGKIPLLGWLFRNTDGGGLVNIPFTLTGPLWNPQYEFHPLGAAKPGVLGSF